MSSSLWDGVTEPAVPDDFIKYFFVQTKVERPSETERGDSQSDPTAGREVPPVQWRVQP